MKRNVVIVYFTVFTALLLNSLISTNIVHAEEINREELVRRIKILDSVNKKNSLILTDQKKILSGHKSAKVIPSRNSLVVYESPSGNCTTPTTQPPDENIYTYLSFTSLGLASIFVVIGPVVEAYRHHRMYGVNNEQVLKSGFMWPVASATGNGMFLAHVITNQEESVVQKYANAIPTAFVMLACGVTITTLLYYGYKNGFRSGE